MSDFQVDALISAIGMLALAFFLLAGVLLYGIYFFKLKIEIVQKKVGDEPEPFNVFPALMDEIKKEKENNKFMVN